MKLGVDVNRHKEIIVKAISAVLLLLLKHFKLNHIYQVSARPSPRQCCPMFIQTTVCRAGCPVQTPVLTVLVCSFLFLLLLFLLLLFLRLLFLLLQFEFMAQHLVFANCIPLILKFFNQNIMSYITAKNR